MKVYLATSGEYSDYRVRGVFTRREDAEAYALGDDVEEYELHNGPVEVRTWHQLSWSPQIPDRERGNMNRANPNKYEERRDFDGHEKHAEHEWREHPIGPILVVSGWDLARVRKVYSEQRAQYLAHKEGIA